MYSCQPFRKSLQRTILSLDYRKDKELDMELTVLQIKNGMLQAKKKLGKKNLNKF
jgi:hypothetical protein